MAADSGRNNALIIEIGRGVFITSLFFLSIALVPFLSAMLLIMIPLPIAFYFAKLGRSKGLFVLAFSLLVLGAAQQILSAQLSIAAFLILGGLGVIISEMFHRRLGCGIRCRAGHSDRIGFLASEGDDLFLLGSQ